MAADWFTENAPKQTKPQDDWFAANSPQSGEFFADNAPKTEEPKTVTGFLGNAVKSAWENTGGIIRDAADIVGGGLEKPGRALQSYANRNKIGTGETVFPKSDREKKFDAAVDLP